MGQTSHMICLKHGQSVQVFLLIKILRATQSMYVNPLGMQLSAAVRTWLGHG